MREEEECEGGERCGGKESGKRREREREEKGKVRGEREEK